MCRAGYKWVFSDVSREYQKSPPGLRALSIILATHGGPQSAIFRASRSPLGAHHQVPQNWVTNHTWDYCDLRFRRRRRHLSRRPVSRALTAFRRSFSASTELKINRMIRFVRKWCCFHTKACIWFATISIVGRLIYTYSQFIHTHGNITLLLLSLATTRHYARGTRCDAIVAIWILSALPRIYATKDDDTAYTTRCPVYDGVAANFVSWLIAFTAWVSWKAPDLVPIFNEKSAGPPPPVDPDHPTAVERKRVREWEQFNTQLYGAIVSNVVAPIQSSLHVQANGNTEIRVAIDGRSSGSHRPSPTNLY